MSRAWIALAVAAVLGLFYVGYGLQSPWDGVVSGQEPPAAAVAGNDEDELRRLLEVRFNAASAEFTSVLERQERLRVRGGGTPPIENVCGAFERFMTASAELATSPADRIKVYEEGLRTAKRLDETTGIIIDRQKWVGKTPGDMLTPIARERTRYLLAQVEIDLIRARRAANNAAGK